MDVSGSPHRGVLSADDMARWQPTVEAPLTYAYSHYNDRAGCEIEIDGSDALDRDALTRHE